MTHLTTGRILLGTCILLSAISQGVSSEAAQRHASDIGSTHGALARYTATKRHLPVLFLRDRISPKNFVATGNETRPANSLSENADLMLAQLALAPSENPVIAAPVNVGSSVSSEGDQWQIDLVWAAPSTPTGSLFVIELVTIPSGSDGLSTLVAYQQTDALSSTIYVDQVPVGLVWRVSRVAADGSEYATGVWTELSAGTDGSKTETAVGPAGRVTIRVRASDAAAQKLAGELSAGLAEGGVWVNLEEADFDQPESSVAYRYTTDAELASRVADYLPVLGPEDATRLVGLEAAPEEVVVTLVGGPAVVDDTE